MSYSDTLALTCPEEEYTNIEEARLRKAIAEHEGWTSVEMRGADFQICVMGFHPESRELFYVPRYTADPAETVRMQAIKHKVTEKDIMRATAEAYEVMKDVKSAKAVKVPIPELP